MSTNTSNNNAARSLTYTVLPSGCKVVVRHRKGRCYACVFSADSTPDQITESMRTGEAQFFPWDESTNTVQWNNPTASQSWSNANKPRTFRK